MLLRFLCYISLIVFASLTISAEEELYPVLYDENVGWINSKGEFAIIPEYDNRYEIVIKNINGVKLPSINYLENVWFNEGLVFVRKHKYFLRIFKYGVDLSYIDKAGFPIIEGLRGEAFKFSEGLAAYTILQRFIQSTENADYSYLNTKGERAFKRNFKMALPFNGGLALVLNNSVYEYINKSGETVISNPEFQGAHSFSEGLASVKINNKWGYIDSTGNFVIEPQYETVGKFSDGIAKVMVNGVWAYIDKAGNYISDIRYINCTDFNNGLAAVLTHNNADWQFINKSGEIAFPLKFQYASQFSDGLALVMKDDLFGYIDVNGEMAIKNNLLYGEDFYRGAAVVYDDWGMHYMNKKGEKFYTIMYNEEIDDYLPSE